MATIRVTHDIGDLADDLAAIPVRAARDVVGIVKRDVTEGNKIAQGIARAASGPHGRLYYKRITAEMRGPFAGEYGPTGDVVGNAVGAGWRHGPPNTDLPKSADIIGPRFADDISKATDGWFW